MADFRGLSVMQYRLLREQLAKGFEQLRQENARGFEQLRQVNARGFEQLRQVNARGFEQPRQVNARGFEQLQQVSSKYAQEEAQRFDRLQEMIRNLQPPQGETRGSSESSNEQPLDEKPKPYR